MATRLRPSGRHIWLAAAFGVLVLSALPLVNAPSTVDAGTPCPDGYTCGELQIEHGGPEGGAGTVVGEGINCLVDGAELSGDCFQFYQYQTDYKLVELTVTAGQWSTYVTGTGSTVGPGVPVTESFLLPPYTETGRFETRFYLGIQELKIVRKGAGSGVVLHSDEGVHCPPDCTIRLQYGTTFGMNADPDPGSFFKTWSGVCAGQGHICVLDMPKSTTVTVTFGLTPAATSTPRPPTAAPTAAPTPAPTLEASPSAPPPTIEPTASAAPSPSIDAGASPAASPVASDPPTSGTGAEGGFGSGLLIGLLIVAIVVVVGGFVFWRRRASAA